MFVLPFGVIKNNNNNNNNVSKCELIAHKDFQVDDALLQSFQRVESEDVSLSGTPLFPGAALDTAVHDRCEDLARAVDRLSAIVFMTP